MKRELPLHVHYRPDTVDRPIWEDVNLHNCYRLPETFAPGDWILDLGAHTGSFAYRCANDGAERVVCVEPSRDCYPLLLHNLRPLLDRITPIHAACWRSDGKPLCFVPFQIGWIPKNTGGGCTMGDLKDPHHDVLAVPLDDLLRLHDRWRLLKLDVEGAEMTILPTSRELGRCVEITGEYHHRDSLLPFADAGMPATMDALGAFLEDQGFTVKVEAKSSGMGLFFARKKTA